MLGIPIVVWGVVLIVAILGLVFRNRLALAIARIFPFFNARTTLLLLGILAVVLGGFGVIMGWITGITGTLGVAGITPVAELPAGNMDYCIYSSASTQLLASENISVVQDPNTVNTVFFYAEESLATGEDDIWINFTCFRAGDIYEDTSVKVTAEGDTFRSEISTTDISEYRIIETSARPSAVFSGEYEQKIYLDESAEATTSDSKEKLDVTYSEGEKSRDVCIFTTIDRTSFAKLSNYTTKYITLRSDGNGKEVGYIGISKLPDNDED